MAKGKYVKNTGKKANNKRAKKRTGRIVVLTVLAVLLVAGLALFVIPQWLYSMNAPEDAFPESSEMIQVEANEEPGTLPADAEETAAPEAELSLPILLEDGKLEITSLHSYNGINPDCGNQEGSDVVGITLLNASGEYLAEANIALTLSDGTAANFRVTDLPAGRTVMAFSMENAVLSRDAGCLEVSCTGTFDPNASLMEQELSVSVDGMTVTLTNLSGRDLTNLVVSCHNILEPEYFGGVTYTYTVENLPAGESATVDAWDCILGMAEVVRVDAE